MASLHPKLIQSLREEETNHESVVIVAHIDCPEVIGRAGRFTYDDKGAIIAHEHGDHVRCSSKADVYDLGKDAAGRRRYRSVCWTVDGENKPQPMHVHDFDDKTYAALTTSLI